MIKWNDPKDCLPELEDGKNRYYLVQLEDDSFDKALYIDNDWYINHGAKLILKVIKWVSSSYKNVDYIKTTDSLPEENSNKKYLISRERYGQVIVDYINGKWIEEGKAEVIGEVFQWVVLE
jgi:hypothetical protein